MSEEKEDVCHWNHRVIKKVEPATQEVYYTIEEVYYTNDVPHSSTIDGARPFGESLEDLRWSLNKMLEALDKPVLEDSIFDGKPV